MFCYQCEETARGTGCTSSGVCGKRPETADMQDRLIYMTKGLAMLSRKAKESGKAVPDVDEFILSALFSTITNTNFSNTALMSYIDRAFELREGMGVSAEGLSEAASVSKEELLTKDVGILSTENEDIRSLRELLTYGLKGLAAYAHHAHVLGYEDPDIYSFIERALVSTLEDHSVDELVALVLECGKVGVDTMALLDKANTETYGNPEPTAVNIGVRGNPAILVSGHDLLDLEQLLEQTKGSGVDVYTHGEMLPANAYPKFKEYDNFVGNYGGSWWRQKTEFEKFNGPILLTTNCLIPPNDSYVSRLYTTGVVGFEGVEYIGEKDGKKDFSAVIEQAKSLPSPTELEKGTIMCGFAHASALSYADKIVEAVKSGDIRKFVVMAGCDGRNKDRQYYTDFANALGPDTVILTAGCAKYRYNKLDLGDIGGIPRILDAGQCNDSYSLAVIAMKLAEAFGLDDINELPISYNIAWYEQKAVLVLLALLHLGVKDITLGPRLPAFVSPAVLDVLVKNFGIRANTTVEEDLKILG